MSNVRKTVAANIKIARENAGYTAEEAGPMLNKASSTVYAYENGSREASYETLAAMAETYGTSVGDFFSSTTTAGAAATTNRKPRATPEFRRLERRLSTLESPDRIRQIAAEAARLIAGGGDDGEEDEVQH